MSAQTPIKTAIVGLSASAVTSWASTAHLPCFVTASGKKRFNITALQNSSVEAAKAAVLEYKLPPTTKAYGSAEELAQDADVQLVVVNTRVDKHIEAARAAILAGKDVYVEWPVAANMTDIQELQTLQRDAGVKVAVGLQGRWAPPVAKLRSLINEGAIGKVLSVNVQAYGGTRDRAVLPTGLKYFGQRQVGGNPVTIGFGHVIDFVQSVVGELKRDKTDARMQLQRPNIPLRDPESSTIVDTLKSDVPDLVSLHGELESSVHTSLNATLSFYYRRGQPFPGDPSLKWSITGEKGELNLIASAGISLQADAYADPVSIHIHDFQTDKVEQIAWDWTETQKEIPVRGRSVQSCLYGFADGDDTAWVSLDDAAARAAQIDGWLANAQVA